MSLFTDASIEAAAREIWRYDEPECDTDPVPAKAALDAAIAALDETELIEKAAKAIEMCEWSAYRESITAETSDEQIARAVLVAIGLLPEETRP